LITQTVTKNEVHFTVLEDIDKFQKYCKKLQIQRIPYLKCNSVIQYKHTVRREKIIELGNKGKTQAEIAHEMNCSYSTVKREIYAIRDELTHIPGDYYK
jgi:DNA-binding NarL/FixJ family response regulator|tara:strand:+ start:307 stop:603 length:297 start_codon:yes stop_codon:yes gene_type:complete